MDPVERVVATDAARALLQRLRERHGVIFLYQSHGCCDGSTPMAFQPGEMRLTPDDLRYGEIDGVTMWVGRTQAAYMQGTQLILDVGQGSLGTFSLEDGEGLHFKVRTRLWTDAEAAWLAAHPLPGLAAG